MGGGLKGDAKGSPLELPPLEVLSLVESMKLFLILCVIFGHGARLPTSKWGIISASKSAHFRVQCDVFTMQIHNYFVPCFLSPCIEVLHWVPTYTSSSLIVGDEDWIVPSKKLLCLCYTRKNYATHEWHNIIVVWLLKMGQPRPLFCLFSVFSNKHCYNFYNKSMWKMSCPWAYSYNH